MAKKAKRSVKKNVFRIVVSLIFIIVGLSSAIPGAIALAGDLLHLQFHSALSVAFDVVMVLAGILGLLKMKRAACVVFSVIIFVGFAVATVSGVMANAGVITVAITAAKAVIAWFYIGCVR